MENLQLSLGIRRWGYEKLPKGGHESTVFGWNAGTGTELRLIQEKGFPRRFVAVTFKACSIREVKQELERLEARLA